MISDVDLVHYGVFSAKNWVSVDCGASELVRVLSNESKTTYEQELGHN